MTSADGSNGNSSSLYAIPDVHCAAAQPLRKVKFQLHKKRMHVVRRESSCTDARAIPVAPTSASLATQMYGSWWRRNVAELENSQTVSACCVVLLVRACAGYGMPKIQFGSKFTACTRSDGSMLTLARSCGTLLACILKVSHPLLCFLILAHET